MAFCIKCGQQLPQGANFCANCGISVENTSNENENQNQRKTVYDGEVHKCPRCGEVLNSFASSCPSCGYEIRGNKVSSSVHNFTMRLSKMNDEQQKIMLIRSFPIPNNKEDILEFIILASSNIEDSIDNELIDAWQVKFEQAYQKANMLFKDDDAFLKIQEIYTSANKKISKRKQAKKVNSVAEKVNFVAVVIVVIGASLAFSIIIRKMQGETETTTISNNKIQEEAEIMYEWPENGLGTYLPYPNTEYGKIYTDDESRFHIELYKVTPQMFKDYFKACKKKGFDIITTNTDSVIHAYNEDEMELDMIFFEENQELDIFLDMPLKMSEIRWPDNEMTKKIPKPNKLIGNISYNNSEHFSVYIDNIDDNEYSEYVDAVIKAGFTKDYSRSDEKYYAYNKSGDYIVVEHLIFDKMYISIKKSEK